MWFTIRKASGKYYATPTGEPEFLIGARVTYNGLVGVANYSVTSTNVYKASVWEPKIGHWAWVIRPTALAESKTQYEMLNTYDRAQFTFGFGQFAAHVPGGDFVKFFRALLALPEARDYFPDLKLVGGKIHQDQGATTFDLETPVNGQTKHLMDYLNPDTTEVGDVELQCCARFMHWAKKTSHQQIQVQVMTETAKRLVGRYSAELNGRKDFVALMVMDIQHQGRAKKDVILAALKPADDDAALTELLKIGATTYAARIKTLHDEIARLRTEGKLGKKKFSSTTGQFA